MFTWSLGPTILYSPFCLPRISSALFAKTSLTFMLKDVPAPAWKTSTTNWSRSLPARISSHACYDGFCGFWFKPTNLHVGGCGGFLYENISLDKLNWCFDSANWKILGCPQRLNSKVSVFWDCSFA